MEKYIINLLALNSLKGVGKKTLNEVPLGVLQSIKEEKYLLAYIQSKEFPLQRKNIQVLSLSDVSAAYDGADKLVMDCKNKGITLITKFDAEKYPQRFFRLADYPPFFFAKGNVDCLKKTGIAVIGTREPSNTGKTWGTRLAEVFAEQGYTVISGLALGCDTCGHQGCLNGNGETIAVMPCPLDKVVPPQNEKLLDKIIKHNGCAISEYPIGAFTSKASFVERDRLQSGLAIGVAVIETGTQGGTWHAVNTAFKIKIPVGFLQFSEHHYAQVETSKGNKLAIEEKGCHGLKDQNSIRDFLIQCCLNDTTGDVKVDVLENVLAEQGNLF